MKTSSRRLCCHLLQHSRIPPQMLPKVYRRPQPSPRHLNSVNTPQKLKREKRYECWLPRTAESCQSFAKFLTKFMFSSFPASENIVANFTQTMSPSATDPKMTSQSQNISASVSLTPSLALFLAAGASAVAEMISQGDLFSSSSSAYLSDNASSSVSKSLTFFP